MSNEMRLRHGRGEVSGCMFQVIGWTKSDLVRRLEQDTSKIQIGTIFVYDSCSAATLIRGQTL